MGFTCGALLKASGVNVPIGAGQVATMHSQRYYRCNRQQALQPSNGTIALLRHYYMFERPRTFEGETRMVAKIPPGVGPQYPQVVVLVGATGDLARRKLLPGLFICQVQALFPTAGSLASPWMIWTPMAFAGWRVTRSPSSLRAKLHRPTGTRFQTGCNMFL